MQSYKNSMSMKTVKIISALVTGALALTGCMKEEAVPSEGLMTGRGIAFRLEHEMFEEEGIPGGENRQAGQEQAADSRSGKSQEGLDRVEIIVVDAEGARVGDLKSLYDKASSTVHVEGLIPGSYRLLVLGMKGDWEKDGITINDVSDISQTWLEFPEDIAAPLEAEYFYSCTPFTVSLKNGEVTADIPGKVVQHRIVGRTDFSFSYRNPFIRTAVISSTIEISSPKFMTSLRADGTLSGSSSGKDISLDMGEKTSYIFLPTVAGTTLDGTSEMITRTYFNDKVRKTYSFSLESVQENRVGRINIDAVHPEDRSGTMFITSAAYEEGHHKAILQDDEHHSIYTDFSQRSFNTAEPLQIQVTDQGQLHVRFYSPRDLEGVLLRARIPEISDEFLDLAYFDRIPAFADFCQSLPCISSSGIYRSESGRLTEVPQLSPEDLGQTVFQVVSEDPYWKKLRKIEHGWTIRFALYGGDPEKPDGGPVGNWMGIRPVHCREVVALFLNFTYMIDMPEHEQILRENEDILYGNGGVTDKVTAETVLLQMRQARTLNVGLVYTGNRVLGLGGGNVFGAYQGGWFEHYTSPYACSVMFHELGHVMGYSHDSSFTYGPWAEQLMNNFYVDNLSKMPVDSPEYLQSNTNPNRYM